MYVLMNINDIR